LSRLTCPWPFSCLSLFDNLHTFSLMVSKLPKRWLLDASTSALIFVLAALPALNILWIIYTTGANNPSNDYLRTIHVVDQILTGGYAWRDYFRDTLENRIHSYAFLMLVRLLIIRLTHWNIYAELFLGWCLACIKLYLLFRLLVPSIPGMLRRWALPFLSALVFSTSQISTYTYGATAHQQGLIQVAGLLGLLLLLSRSHGWVLFLGAVTCGLIASWSGGGGLVVWPVFLVALILGGSRKIGYYLGWLLGLGVAVWPYVVYGVLGNPGGLLATVTPRWMGFLITAFGYPFANQIGSGGLDRHAGAFWVGLAGITLFLFGLVIILAGDPREVSRRVLPALLLIFWGVLNAVQTTLSRSLLAPWYTTSLVLFWLGMVGLAFTFLERSIPATPHPSFSRLKPWWGMMVLTGVFVLYLGTNLSYRDKSFYLASRSPASAACLRSYRTAPTYCEERVFQWGIGHPTYLAELAWPLEKHGLSVFAPRQQWTMQGDFVLSRVRVIEQPGVPRVAWTAGWSDQPSTWRDDRHLNLYLHSPNEIAWQIDLPANLKMAVFRTSVAQDKAVSLDPQADGFDFRIDLQLEGEARRTVFTLPIAPGQTNWQAIALPLTEYAGKTITAYLASNGRANFVADGMLVRYPRIDLELDAPQSQPDEPRVTPSNTDLYPDMSTSTSGDFKLDTRQMDAWVVTGADPSPQQPQTWVIDGQASFELQKPIDICLKDYSQFYFQMFTTANISPLAVHVLFKLDGQPDFTAENSLWIPLLADGKRHTYSYDLKLFESPTGARLTGLRMDPGAQPKPGVESLIAITGVGLRPGEITGFCASQP